MTKNQKRLQHSAISFMRACLDSLEGHIQNDNAEAIEFFACQITQQARFIKHSLEDWDAPQQ